MTVKQARILIVDDQPTNIKVLSDLLVDYGFEVLVAKDGENALQKLQRVLPDLILLDVLMPGIDGFETCRTLKAMETTRQVPVIFMTALSDPVDKIKGLTLGAVDYITKPFQHEEVIARIDIHLKLQSLTRQLEAQNAQLMQEVRSRQLAEAALRQSEEKFSKAFRSNPGATTITTLEDWRFLEVNQHFCNITGYALEEVLDKTGEQIYLWVNPDDLPGIQQTLREVGAITRKEVQFRTKSGAVRSILLSAEVVSIWDTPCVLAMTYDITACKQTAAALLEKEEFLRSIYEGVEEPIFVVDVLEDNEFRYVGLNPAHGRLTGIAGTEVQGKTPDEAFEPETAAVLKQNYQACLAAGERITYEESLCLDGQDRWWLTSLSPLRNPDGQIYRIIGTSVDITARKQLELQLDAQNLRLQQEIRERQQQSAELKQAKEAADTASRAKTTFLASMSHELRTPLNSILGFSQLLSHDQTLQPQQREQVALINRSGEHLLGLINDVLEVSKIEAGRLTLNSNQVDLTLLLSSLTQVLQTRAEAKGLQLVVELAPSLPQLVQTDGGKLRQVLMNLLDNAIKFTQSGQVILRVYPGDGWQQDPHESEVLPSLPLHFEVEDTGSGIAPEEQGQLFEAFVQTEAGRKSQRGTGLGLFISRQLVRLLGGEITATSTLGKGTWFHFHILVHPVLCPEALIPTPINRVVGLAPDQPRYRILVVEDVLDNRLFLAQALAAVGFEVQEAENGQTAIALWETWHPDLILMDLRLPGLDGYEATRAIKAQAQAQGKSVVIIAVTAIALEGSDETIARAGCDDVIRKPFSDSQILSKLAEYLGVRYLYAPDPLPGTSHLPSPPTGGPETGYQLTSERFTVLPAQWCDEFYRAALRLNSEQCLKLIGQIPGSEAPLARALTELVDNFQFEKILHLTREFHHER